MKSNADKLAAWKTISKEVVFETPWFKIRKQHMRTTDNVELDYYIHDTNDSVVCVCVSSDNKVLIEQQYRPAVDKVSIDYPAGKMEHDDASTEAAITGRSRLRSKFY